MQPVELFSNFFLMSDMPESACADESTTIHLDRESLSQALKRALVARRELQVVYVVCGNVAKLKSFVNSLIMNIGKVDFAEVHEIRLMNDCIFLP